MKTLLTIISISLLTLSAALALEEELKVTVEARKVTLVEGKKVFEKVEKALPGERIHYNANYLNLSEAVLTNVRPELSLPEGTTFIEGSLKPQATEVKVGDVYLPWPLTDKQAEEIKISDYEAFRWKIAALPPQAERAFSLTIKISE